MSLHHHHSHHSAQAASTPLKILVFCIVFNVIFVLAEAWVGWQSNSTGLVSDAGHNLSDVLGLVLSMIAILLERRKAENAQRVSRYVTLLNGLLLLAAVVIIGAESVEKILQPAAINSAAVIYTAAVAIAVNGLTAWLLMRSNKNNLNIRAAFLHAATDMLVSVGVVVSGIVIHFTGWNIIDPIVSLVITLAIAVPTAKLLIHTVKDIRKV